MLSTSNQRFLARVAILLVTLLTPVLLVLTSVRLLLTDGFVQLQYDAPGFPDDPYGFTRAERLKWASLSLEYLLNDQGIEFLGDEELQPGSPLYNARELRHMMDVKDTVQIALTVWQLTMVFFIVLVILLALFCGMGDVGRALKAGAKLTLILMGILLLGVIVIFPIVFVAFHEVFFDPGTWMFSFQDSLIRLFPQRFWQVAFLAVGILTALQAGVVWLAGGLSARLESRTLSSRR